MCENRQSGFAIDTNSSRLQWGTVPHQDPTKSSAIANRNCRVPDAASGREAIRAAGLGCHQVSKLVAPARGRGGGRGGNGGRTRQHRDGSSSSRVPTHGRNRLAAAALQQHCDRHERNGQELKAPLDSPEHYRHA